MKFEELKSSLKTNIKGAYLLNGIDEYLLSSAYNLIVKYSNIEMPEMNLISFVEAPIDCDSVVRALETMPVFSSKKLVYVDARMIKKSDLKNVKLLEEYLNNPSPEAILVVNTGENTDNLGLDKKLFEEVDCNRLDVKLVLLKTRATLQSKGKIIEDGALNLLCDYCLGDLGKILLECDKLVAFVGERVKVEKVDIDTIVTRSLEYKIFELTESLSKKDSVKVFTILNDLKAKKDEYKTVPNLIYSHFRRLFQISLNKDLNNFELSKLLGVKEYAIKMSLTQLKLFNKSSLKKINELCIKIDTDLKQSNISIDNAINLIVLSILNL